MESPEFVRDLESCRTSELVNYGGVAHLKRSVLEILFEASRAAPDRTRWKAFEQFRQQRGPTLQQNCLFLALREHFAAENPARANWPAWPDEYRDCASAGVQEFSKRHEDRVQFLAWVQWIADDQLATAQ